MDHENKNTSIDIKYNYFFKDKKRDLARPIGLAAASSFPLRDSEFLILVKDEINV